MEQEAMTQRRAEGRDRLRRLAEEGMPERTKEQAELERLREYLVMWARNEMSTRLHLGAPEGVPYLDSIRGTIDGYATGQDYDERLDRWARDIIDTSIDDLMELPDGELMRAALRARYLNEGVSRDAGFAVRVFRMKKLEHLSLVQADILADRAEQALIPVLKRRGIPL
jgi:hypothetical protein